MCIALQIPQSVHLFTSYTKRDSPGADARRLSLNWWDLSKWYSTTKYHSSFIVWYYSTIVSHNCQVQFFWKRKTVLKINGFSKVPTHIFTVSRMARAMMSLNELKMSQIKILCIFQRIFGQFSEWSVDCPCIIHPLFCGFIHRRRNSHPIFYGLPPTILRLQPTFCKLPPTFLRPE